MIVPDQLAGKDPQPMMWKKDSVLLHFRLKFEFYEKNHRGSSQLSPSSVVAVDGTSVVT